jgi:hypothetical protein
MPSVEAWKSERLGATIAVELLYNGIQNYARNIQLQVQKLSNKIPRSKSKRATQEKAMADI